MDTINKILKAVLSLCLGALAVSTIACASSSKIDVSTDEEIAMTPFGKLGIGQHVDRLISEVEKEGEGEFYSPSAVLLDQTHLFFRSDYFVCNVNIEKAHVDWVLDLRDLYGKTPDPTENARAFYTNLRSEVSPNGRFIFYWNCDKPLFLLDLTDQEIYKIEVPFQYDLTVYPDTIVVTNDEDRKTYGISLDTLSVEPNPTPEATAEQTKNDALPADMMISVEDVLYRGSQYFVYLKDSREFSVIDKKSGNWVDTSHFAFENPNSFQSINKEEEAVIFECDNGFYTIYKNEVKRFDDGKIAYEDIDLCKRGYVYTQDGTNVYPFKIRLRLFDVERAVVMPYELDIKNLL